MLRRNSRQKRPTDGIGLEAVAQHALLVVEAELLDDRAVEDDQRLGARRVAAVLDAVSRVGHGLDRATSTGMYSGRQPAITPLTAISRPWRAPVGQDTPITSSGSRSVKRRNPRRARAWAARSAARRSTRSRRKSGSPRRSRRWKTMSRGPGLRSSFRRAPGFSVRPLITSSRVTPARCASTLGALDADMARHQRTGRFGMPRPTEWSRPDRQKPSHQRERRHAGPPRRTGPQHGGRAASSTAHPGDDGVDPEAP